MAPGKAARLINQWETIRCELLSTRVSDLGLRIGGSPIEPFISRLRRELAAKKLRYQPPFYLSDGWGCPNEVPVIGVPFYLADRRLARIEEEQTGEIEDDRTIMMFLRHETGHAFNYAYRLWEHPGWIEAFGPFHKAYRETTRIRPLSRDFVRHLVTRQYGRNYAQKHPDEDFAETFAVWLTPRSGWRKKYRHWPALRKLRTVDRLMRHIREEPPVVFGGDLLHPVKEMRLLLAEHYGQRADRFRAEAIGYVDDKLREVFPPLPHRAGSRTVKSACRLLRRVRGELVARVTRWSGLDEAEVVAILDKISDRSRALRLFFRPSQVEAKLMDLTSLVTALALDFAYTGRLTG